MELIVGENSYMTIEEANEIVNNILMSSSEIAIKWNELSDKDKTTIIYVSTQMLENTNMQWIGKKKSSTQKMEWPRIISGKEVQVPDSVKVGILQQGIIDYLSNTDDISTYASKGVKSLSDGAGASITFMNRNELVSSARKVNGFNYELFNNCFSKYSYIID